ncbi:MAG: GerMN domain-containing protein [Oscillospiraceae bacterium]|nr:GerMN domain-containing protein [Oscillospiraceae bacterium]
MKTCLKTCISLFLSIGLFTACAVRGAPPDEAGPGEVFIYRTRTGERIYSDRLITYEIVTTPVSVSKRDVVINALNSPAFTAGLSGSLPDGVKIISVDTANGFALVTVSDNFEELPAFEKTLAGSCITLTLCELEDISSVTIRAAGSMIFEALTPDGIMLYDTETLPYEKSLRLYFTDTSVDLLRPEYHTLTVDADTPLERYVIEELLRGPYNESLLSFIPPGTELLAITTEEGLCTVDLSSAFIDNEPPEPAVARLAVYSIVNSLTSLKETDFVLFLSDGKPISYYGLLNMSIPFERNDSLVARTA